MKLLTKEQEGKLTANGNLDEDSQSQVTPVVKLFTPDANCTWLLFWTDPQHPDHAFGWCDLGMGYPELGFVSLSELSTLRGQLGLPVERDLHFSSDKTPRDYLNGQ